MNTTAQNDTTAKATDKVAEADAEKTPAIMQDKTFNAKLRAFEKNDIDGQFLELLRAAVPHSLKHGDYRRLNALGAALKGKAGMYKTYRRILPAVSAWKMDFKTLAIKEGTKISKTKKDRLINPADDGYWEKVIDLFLEHLADENSEPASFNADKFAKEGLVNQMVKGLKHGVKLTAQQMADQMVAANAKYVKWQAEEAAKQAKLDAEKTAKQKTTGDDTPEAQPA